MRDFIGKILSKKCFHNPIFIVGAARSGTSVLLQALGKHPLILSMAGEAPFITSMGGASYLFEFAENREYYLQSLKISKDYLYNYFRRISFEVAIGRNFGLSRMVQGIINRDLLPIRKHFWCAKTFPDHIVSKGLLKLYPKAKYIYIVRNGLDVVQSMSKFSGFRRQDFDNNCKAWRKSVDNFSYLLNVEHAIIVRHEQLVTNPDEVFRKIFSFIGVNYNVNSVNFTKNTIVHPLDKSTQRDINVEEIFKKRKAAFENWSHEQRKLFENICGNAMNKLDYEIPYNKSK